MADATPSQQPLCFVIGPIGKEGSEERRHADFLLHGLIKYVLEGGEFGYAVKRADEDADPGMITDRVISDIVHANLVVADLTGLNPNAFYELGIRHSAEKPAIHIAKAGTILPFDNVAHRAIFVDVSDWRSISDARARLAASVRTVQAEGYVVSNPITQANATFKMRASADPQERVIADMQEKLSSLEASVAAMQFIAMGAFDSPSAPAFGLLSQIGTSVGPPQEGVLSRHLRENVRVGTAISPSGMTPTEQPGGITPSGSQGPFQR